MNYKQVQENVRVRGSVIIGAQKSVVSVVHSAVTIHVSSFQEARQLGLYGIASVRVCIVRIGVIQMSVI